MQEMAVLQEANSYWSLYEEIHSVAPTQQELEHHCWRAMSF